MLWTRTRVLLIGAVLSLSTIAGGTPSYAQQADPQAQLATINSQLDKARSQAAESSRALAAAKAKLDETTTSLAQAKTEAANLQGSNPQQIDQLKQQLAGAQSELAAILKDNTNRQNQLISDLGANQQLIDQTNDQIAGTNQQIGQTNSRLADLAQQIDQIHQDQAETQQELGIFLKTTYQEQRRSLLEFLLESVSFGDFLSRVSYTQTLAAQQDQLLSLLHSQAQALTNSQAEQQTQLDSLHNLQAQQQAQMETLQLQGKDQAQRLEQARVEAQAANERISAHEAQVQALIDQKQGEMTQNQQLLQSLQAAHDQLNSTIVTQAGILTNAQQQEQAIAALIKQAAPAPAPARRATTTARASSRVQTAPVVYSGANSFPYGECTWWAAHVRPDIGGRVSGNASNWFVSAQRAGLAVGSAPRVGAIVVYQPGAQGAAWTGHVAHVTSVSADGQHFTVDEMHYPWLGVVSHRASSTGWGVGFIY